jgi:phosphatidylserine/phosphatidylglycerophosphate/cardiolipin synthase-like enzyme
MTLGTMNKLLAVAVVLGLGFLLLQRMPPNKKISGILNEVVTQERASTRLTHDWVAATHYAPDENLEGIDIGVLDHAKSHIDAAMYSFTDRLIEHELQRKAKDGVQIRIYRDQEQYREEKQRARSRGELCVTDELANTQNVHVKIKAGEDLMHEKDFDVDGIMLRTGSANWSFGGLRRQDNIALYTQAPQDVARFRKKYEEMWSRSDNQDVR